MFKKILSPMVALAVAAASYLAAQTLPDTLSLQVGTPAWQSNAQVKAKDLTLVCPGSAFASGGKSGTNVQSFARIGSSVVDYSSNLPTGVTLKTMPLTGPAAGRGSLSDTGNKLANFAAQSTVGVTVKDPSGQAQQGSASLTAQSYEIAAAKGINGAIGANCQNPSTESWLLGGVTNVGREALLIIANPASTDATVDLQLFGDNGAIDGAGLNGVSVSANRTVVLPLAGFAPQQSSLTVHVQSRGAAVATWIQERTVRGTESAGADLVSPSIPASTQLVIPGLLKRGTTDATKLISGNPDYADLTPSVHLYVPGTQVATVTVQVIGIGPKATGTVLQQQVQGQRSATFDLTGLKDGDYSVFVTSDQPVQAAVKLSRTKAGSTPVTDFAWLPAVEPISTKVVSTAANSAVSKVSISNGGSQGATAVVTDLTTGGSQRVSVSHLGSAVVTVTPGDVFAVTSDQPVASTMIADFSGSIAAIPLVDYKNLGGSLAIVVR